MLKYRASRSFRIWMMVLVPLLGCLYFGLLPELEAMRNPEIPGRIVFKDPRPDPGTITTAGTGRTRMSGRAKDWLLDRCDDAMSWEHNPWKTERNHFGSRYFKLLASKDTKERALAMELRRLAEALHKRVLERYPELAVADKKVPPERNGFLKWLEFSERFDADPSRPGDPKSKALGLPEEIKKHLDHQGPWDAAAAKAWLGKEKALLDEIRAIGLMPEQSIAGIGIDRWGFLPARLAKNCAEALLIDARVAAEEGRIDDALQSIQAAKGLAAHFSQVETPSLLGVTVRILVDLRVQAYSLSEIMPALPAGQLDPAVWEKVVNPQVSPPAEFARVMKGEWNVTAREYVMPMLSDTRDPKYPADPEAVIDHYSGYFVRVIENYDSPSPADWTTISPTGFPDNSHLSRDGRELTEMLGIGADAWSKGMIRAQNQHAMTQAAFAIMKGEAIPNDPIHGQPYRWNPATRELSAPDSPAFADMDLTPIRVPRP